MCSSNGARWCGGRFFFPFAPVHWKRTVDTMRFSWKAYLRYLIFPSQSPYWKCLVCMRTTNRLLVAFHCLIPRECVAQLGCLIRPIHIHKVYLCLTPVVCRAFVAHPFYMTDYALITNSIDGIVAFSLAISFRFVKMMRVNKYWRWSHTERRKEWKKAATKFLFPQLFFCCHPRTFARVRSKREVKSDEVKLVSLSLVLALAVLCAPLLLAIVCALWTRAFQFDTHTFYFNPHLT